MSRIFYFTQLLFCYIFMFVRIHVFFFNKQVLYFLSCVYIFLSCFFRHHLQILVLKKLYFIILQKLMNEYFVFH